MGAAVQQQDPYLTVEYQYQVTQDGRERLVSALDVILGLIFAEFEADLTERQPAQDTERVL